MNREEAIKIVKSHYPANKQMLNEALEYLIPELKEKTDKEMIQKLITVVHLYYGEGVDAERDECLEWLEKQNSNVANANKEYWRGYREGKQEILDKYAALEKQGEQKPADKVESKFKVKYADSEYSVQEVKDIAGITFYGIEDEPNHIDYVKADSCEIINGGYNIKENGCSFPTKSIIFSEQKPIERNDFVSIPFGAFDSELVEETITVPDGCYATIEGNRIHIKKKIKN